MSMTVVIGLALLAWFLVATLVAVIVARITTLRDRQHPHQAAPGVTARGVAAYGTEWLSLGPGRVQSGTADVGAGSARG